ncbi:MAG: hypothetical protein JRL30_26010, partial [Deltaproteobacteria bacterium]|nr:hypothetical protein [Deltaproteobacteria bacterium]
AAFMKARDIVAAVSFPLRTKDRTLGVLNASRVGEGVPFCQGDLELLSIICRQAVMALESMRITEERAERMRIRTLFAQYVAPEVAEAILSSGIDPMSMGEIKDITILFADIRNFTPLVRQMPLEILRSFLNDFFALLSEAVFSFGGTLDKFIGGRIVRPDAHYRKSEGQAKFSVSHLGGAVATSERHGQTHTRFFRFSLASGRAVYWRSNLHFPVFCWSRQKPSLAN